MHAGGPRQAIEAPSQDVPLEELDDAQQVVELEAGQGVHPIHQIFRDRDDL